MERLDAEDLKLVATIARKILAPEKHGAIDKSTKKVGVDIIVRDHKGQVLA